MVLGYFELPDDERPDELIWHHQERLTEWFEAVTERRKNPGMYPVDDIEGPTMKNEYLEEIMGGGESGN
jgi:hypothetical protein